MKFLKTSLIALVCMLIMSSNIDAKEHLSFGVINLVKCVRESKLGGQEEGKLKSFQQEMQMEMQKKETRLNELSKKFEPEYLDSISDDEEKELKEQFRSASEDIRQHEARFYQMMKQNHLRLQQVVMAGVKAASEEVAEEKGLDLVINQEALLYYDDKTDITMDIVEKMDEVFDARHSEKMEEKSEE